MNKILWKIFIRNNRMSPPDKQKRLIFVVYITISLVR